MGSPGECRCSAGLLVVTWGLWEPPRCGGFVRLGWRLIMFDDEGAVNELADVSPTDSEDWVYSDEPTAAVGERSYLEAEPVTVDEDDPDDPEDRREAFIPRDRFDQVHGRAQELERELLWQREQHELARRAMAAGYRDVAQYEQDDAWARAHHYAG